MGNASGGTVQINGVTAVTPTNDGRRLLTGGADGKVRVWAVSKAQQVMVASMQEHKGPIFSIAIRANDSECVSASADGSCIVWALAGLTPAHAFAKGRQRVVPQSSCAEPFVFSSRIRRYEVVAAQAGAPVRACVEPVWEVCCGREFWLLK